MKNAAKNILIIATLALIAGGGLAGGAALSGFLKANKANTPVDEEISSRTASSEASASSSSASAQHAPIIGVTGEGGRTGTLYRTGAALGKTYSINSEAGTIQSDFDDVFPYSEIREVSDNAGNVFVRIPKHYTRYTYNSSTYIVDTEICEERLEGFVLNPIFTDGQGNEIDYIMVGKYGATGSSSRAYSKSGQTTLTNITHEGMRTACEANGDGYQQMDIWCWTMLQDLFKIEFATTNCQTIMTGNVAGSKQNSGKCDSIGENKSGWDLTTGCMTYRGIENLWGNVTQWCDGMTFNNHDVYVCSDPEEYESAKTTDPYVKLSYKVNQNGNGNSNRHGWDPSCPFIRLSVATNGTDYDAGGYWYDYTGDYTNPCPLVGGSYGSGSAAGLWYVSSSTVSNSSGSLGGRLLLR